MELRKTDEEIMKGEGKRERERERERPKGGGKNWSVQGNNLRKKPKL